MGEKLGRIFILPWGLAKIRWQSWMTGNCAQIQLQGKELANWFNGSIFSLNFTMWWWRCEVWRRMCMSHRDFPQIRVWLAHPHVKVSHPPAYSSLAGYHNRPIQFVKNNWFSCLNLCHFLTPRSIFLQLSHMLSSKHRWKFSFVSLHCLIAITIYFYIYTHIKECSQMISTEGEGNSWCILFALDGFFSHYLLNTTIRNRQN